MATSAALTKDIQLAQTLPPRLLRFFARYPPSHFGHGIVAPPSAPTQGSEDAADATSGPTSVDPAEQSPAAMTSTTATTPSTTPPGTNPYIKPWLVVSLRPPIHHIQGSPFAPHKNTKTGFWRGPHFSLRRQADLCKLAERHGVADLMPWSLKLKSVRAERRENRGLRVRGTGEGQMVKGHRWERTVEHKIEKRKQAMLEMPALIDEWKKKAHGRKWKKYPK